MNKFRFVFLFISFVLCHLNYLFAAVEVGQQLTYKYITFKVQETKDWLAGRQWVKVNTPLFGDAWGLIDADGCFIHGPEFKQVRLGGDLACVTYDIKFYGFPENGLGKQYKPYCALINLDGAVVRQISHSYKNPLPKQPVFNNLGIWEYGLNKVPTNETPAHITATPGFSFGYLQLRGHPLGLTEHGAIDRKGYREKQ